MFYSFHYTSFLTLGLNLFPGMLFIDFVVNGFAFLTSVSHNSPLALVNTTDFCIFTLVLQLVDLFISYNCF
jgi:hypothetical protein